MNVVEVKNYSNAVERRCMFCGATSYQQEGEEGVNFRHKDNCFTLKEYGHENEEKSET